MPVQVIDLDLTAETGPVSQPTHTDVGIVGTSDTAPPSADFGEVNRYERLANVESDYGTDADVATSAAAVFEMGAAYCYVMQLEENEQTENLTDGTTLANTPALGTPTPTVDSGTLSFVAGEPTASGDLGTDEHELNTESGAFGSGGSGVDVTYSYVDWSKLDLFNPYVNRLIVADRHMGREHIGTLDALVSHANGTRMGVVAAGVDGTGAEDDVTRETYHDVFGYAPSGDTLPVAHKSSADVAAYVAGQLAVNRPSFDPFYDSDGYPFETGWYQDAQVGDPSTEGTFEGGSTTDQVGPVNVLIDKDGTTVLSNSLTTAGVDSDYRYFDVAMTQNFIATQIENALENLRLSQDRIPFTEAGRTQIRSTIVNTVAANTGGLEAPLSDFTVTVPTVESLTDNQKAERRWTGIQVDGILSGNVHEFGVELTVAV